MDNREQMLEAADRYWEAQAPATLDDFIRLKDEAITKVASLRKNIKSADSVGDTKTAEQLRREAEPWQQKEQKFLAPLRLLNMTKATFNAVYKPLRDLPAATLKEEGSISGKQIVDLTRELAIAFLKRELAYIYNPTGLEEYNEAADALAQKTMNAHIMKATMGRFSGIGSSDVKETNINISAHHAMLEDLPPAFVTGFVQRQAEEALKIGNPPSAELQVAELMGRLSGNVKKRDS